MMKRQLKDLNLIDDFLFEEAITREKEGEEFCKILLSTILGKEIRHVKVIAQKSIKGTNVSRHGIKIDAYIEAMTEDHEEIEDARIQTDIYDIEPNKYQTDAEAKRTRYYHALIDSKILKSGVDYGKLKNVIIIMILPYDPFGKDRMVYTFETGCKEDPTIPYEDGIKTIYLYTKGTQGNPSQELKDMLKYLEHSTLQNVQNEKLAKIHKMVDAIKQDGEVGVSYMKSWEWEEMIRRQGISKGETVKLISQVKKKIEKGIHAEDIANILEEDIQLITKIHDSIRTYPDWDNEKIYDHLTQSETTNYPQIP